MLGNKMTTLIYRIVFGLMILSFAYFAYKGLQIALKPVSVTNKEICLTDKQADYKGIITKTYISRGDLISILDSKIKFMWWCKSKVRDIIEVGDSIYKPSGTFDTYIFKKANPDSVILIECDFDCDYWEKRYGKD